MTIEKAGSNQLRSEDTGWLIKSIERMFRPMVRLLVGRVSCNVIVDLIKQIFVQEARRELSLSDPGKRITKSALALITGLDTRAITALEDSTHDYSIVDLSPEAAVLGVWATDELFQDPRTGKPVDLPIYGRGLSFQNLVTRTVGRNVTCITVLDRLEESGNIEMLGDNYVRLKERFYVPVNESERTFLEAGSLAVNRLMGTIGYNMEHARQPSARWLQQDRWSKRLHPEQLEAFRADLRKLLDRHIKEAEAQIEKFEDPVRTDKHCSAGVGWYYWEENSGR